MVRRSIKGVPIGVCIAWCMFDKETGGFLYKNDIRGGFLHFEDGVSESFIFPDIL